jgi:hypothetical protein
VLPALTSVFDHHRVAVAVDDAVDDAAELDAAVWCVDFEQPVPVTAIAGTAAAHLPTPGVNWIRFMPSG